MAPTTHKFDVLVVGGGPAGLSAAAAVAKGDSRVAVIEKDRGIANTIRTSGVTWLPEIEKLGLPRNLYNPIRRYEIYSPTKEYVLETPEAGACALDVRRLYQYLAHQAGALGAEIFLGTKVNFASYENGKSAVRITASSPSGRLDFCGSIAIDASGFSTIVGRSLGLANKWKRFGMGAEYEAYAEKVDVETWGLMVGRMYSPAGYAWLFPVGENRVRIGVGIGRPESDIDPFQQLTYLMKKRLGPLKKLGRVCPLELHRGVVPSQGPRDLTVADHLLLVGDSAGHLNPLILEGIRFAIKFGRIAGEVTRHAIDKAGAPKAQLDEYEKRWKKEVWSDFQVGLSVQEKWLKLSDEQWDKEISILDSLSAKEVLGLLRSQFSTRRLLGLIAKHPKLRRTRTFSAILQKKLKRTLSPRKCARALLPSC
ncbi:MAG: NAD(P)/FAD-dependent oxidoreductase [Candidatus Bathyarchaeota archaeon]|nr:NAD(P)/FAD-dependent oxidoreductase [Candidatus Bathyarchaeota archaeon]